jgi:MFS transporter, putative metabolite:H+ symporter
LWSSKSRVRPWCAPRSGRQCARHGAFAEIWQPPVDRRATILSVFNFFQTFGYYGFAEWVPTLQIAKGVKVTRSLEYSFIIAIANPIGPLLRTLIADRIDRKWQVCLGAFGIGVVGMLFANRELPAMLILWVCW